jgi:hypothetical protein
MMKFDLKRIDPYWHTHPMIPTAVVGGAILVLMSWRTGHALVGMGGGLLAALAVIWAVRPALSGLVMGLGLFAGILYFGVLPPAAMAGYGIGSRLMAIGFFALFYMILMDSLFLVVSVCYNFLAGVTDLGGLRFEFEQAGAVEEEASEPLS